MNDDGLDILDFTITTIKQIVDRKEAYAYEQKTIKKYRKKCGVFNNDFSKNHWALGTKGVLKANSGSFKKGKEPSETSFKKGNEPWNKGKKGVQDSSCKGTITIHKDDKNKRIPADKLDEYLANGYKKGMKPRKQAKGYAVTKNGRYQAYLTINGKLKTLGTFDTEEEAIRCRAKALQ